MTTTSLWLLCSVIQFPLAQGGASGSGLIDEGQLHQAGLVKFWEAKLPLAPGDTVDAGYLVDEALYVTSDFGKIFALKADVGLLRWGVELTAPDFRILPPTHVLTADGAGPVVIPTTTGTFVLDRFTGEQLQRFSPEFAVSSPAVAFDRHLLMGGADSRFYSLVFNDPRMDRPIKRWDVLVKGPVTASPVLFDDGSLLLASTAGVVIACGARDKAFLWSYETGGPLLADPAVDATGAYVAGMDRSLYKLDKASGNVLWRVRFPRSLDVGPVVLDDTVFQYCSGHGLTALAVDNGTERWRNPSAVALAGHSEAGDVLLRDDHRIETVEHATGKSRGIADSPGVRKAVVNTIDDSAYFLGDGGRVICLRLDRVPYLRRQQITAARQQLNASPVDASTTTKIEKPLKPVLDEERDPLRSPSDTKPQR
ncbi:MAG: PQQ-binding-like beta-propeller repeat protein [Planctomycetota bacterium]